MRPVFLVAYLLLGSTLLTLMILPVPASTAGGGIAENSSRAGYSSGSPSAPGTTTGDENRANVSATKNTFSVPPAKHISFPIGNTPNAAGVYNVLSANWEGYVIQGAAGSVNNVQGSWYVPSVACTQTPNSVSASWIGIDGWGSGTVEQIGTESDCSGSTAQYQAWYEFYPQIYMTSIPYSIGPGDLMMAYVYTASSVYYLNECDFTRNWCYETSGTVNGGAADTSAEWITEAYSLCPNGIPSCQEQPLANFGRTYYGNSFTGLANHGATNYAQIGQNFGPIGSFTQMDGVTVYNVEMYGCPSGCPALTSGLSQDGTSFYTSWVSVPAPRSTGVSVSPNSFSAITGSTITFTATVTDTGAGTPSSPVGIVSWSATNIPSGLNSLSCSLMAIGSASSSCATTDTVPYATGAVTITASYTGDSVHSAAPGTSLFTIAGDLCSVIETGTIVQTTPFITSSQTSSTNGNRVVAKVCGYALNPAFDGDLSNNYYLFNINAIASAGSSWSVSTGGLGDSNGPSLKVTAQALCTNCYLVLGSTTYYPSSQVSTPGGVATTASISIVEGSGSAGIATTWIPPKTVTAPSLAGGAITWNSGVNTGGAYSGDYAYNFELTVQVPKGETPQLTATVVGNFWQTCFLCFGHDHVTATNSGSYALPGALTSPNTQANGAFGWSVAESGNIVIVGAPIETANGLSGAGHAYTFNAATGALISTFTSPNAQLGGSFGYSVAVSGNTVVIGAPYETVNGLSGSGRAYTFNAATGALISTLASPQALANGKFGFSVAVSGSTVVVGAPYKTTNGLTGAGRAFTFNAATGALVSTLTSPNTQTNGAFGRSVAISGNTVVVGATGETVNGLSGAGRAYTFNAATGALISTLTSPNAPASGAFGWSVAVSGNTVVVGAISEAANGLSGAGHAYTFNAATGALVSTLTSPNAQASGEFGRSVAVSGSTVVVGADYETARGLSGAGRAYTFNAATGALISTLTSPNAQYGLFGFSVAISGNAVVVGAFDETSNGQTYAGNAYVFTFGMVSFSSPAPGSSFSGTQAYTIAGSVSPAPGQADDILIIVSNPSGVTVTAASISADPSTGAFSYGAATGGNPNWISGTYTISAIDSFGATGSTTFSYTAPLLSVSVPAPAPIDSGQSATLTATASGGSGSYSTYAFYLGSSCTGVALQSSSSNTYSTGALTFTTTYCIKVTDSLGTTATTTATVTVNLPLSALAITPPAPSIYYGQSITLTANPSGGATPYSYQWYAGAGCTNPISGATSPTYSASPTTTTTYYYKVTDSSSAGAESMCSPGDTVTVGPAFSLTGTCISSANGYTGEVDYDFSAWPRLYWPYSGSVNVTSGGPPQCVGAAVYTDWLGFCLGYDMYPMMTPGPTTITLFASTPAGEEQSTDLAYQCGGVVLTLSPSTATNPAGTLHTVTLTALDYYPPGYGSEPLSGYPAEGLQVSINITAGPNAGKSVSGFTDSSGHFYFTYSDTGGAGTDSITAYFTYYSTELPSSSWDKSNTVTKVWSPALPTQPLTVTVLEVGAPTGTYTVNGCSPSPTTGLTGTTTSFTMASSCSFTISFTNSGSVRWGFASGGVFSATSGTLGPTCSGGTCSTISVYADYQVLLTVNGGNGVTYSMPSETSDGWYKYGDFLVVSSNGIWGRSAGTGTRLASWNLDGGPNTNVAQTATLNLLLAMAATHTVNFNSVTQYQITFVNSPSSGGTSAATTSPTISGDTGWYDAGTSVQISATPSIGYTFTLWTGTGGSGTLGLDGSGSNQCSGGTVTSCSVSLTTASTNDVVMLYVYQATGTTPYTIADTAGLTWHKRGISGSPTAYAVYYAIAGSKLSSDSITASLSGSTVTLQMMAFGVSGANTASPFDPGVPSECMSKGTVAVGGTMSCSITTSHANDMVIGFAKDVEGGGITAGSGYTQITSSTASGIVAAEYEVVSSAGTYSISWKNSASSSQTMNVAGDAIVAGGSTGSYTGPNNPATVAMNAAIQETATFTPITTRSSTTTVTPSTTSEIIGNISPVTFTATVADTSPGTPSAPTGTVTWNDGGKGGTFSSTTCTLSPATSSSSTCTVTYTPSSSSAAGTTGIAASYSGDGSHGTSSGSGSITINKRSTSTIITPSSLTATHGTLITLTVTVTDTGPGTATSPTGTVTWKFGSSGGGVTCTLKASGPGVSTCSVTGKAPATTGLYTITATYNGDSTHNTSSGTSSLTVT